VLAPRPLVLFVAAATLFAAGCGGGGETLVSPSPTPPTTQTLAITGGVDALRTGYFADFTVSATMTDGTQQNVTTKAALATNDESVATIDRNGRVTALNHGAVTLSATFGERTTTRQVSIIRNYGGAWTGTYIVRSCDQSGVFVSAHYCQNLGAQPLPLSIALSQSGKNVDEIGGTISVRNLAGAVSGYVTPEGRLVLNGSYLAVAGGATFQVDLLTWDTVASGVTMTGWFAHNLSVPGSAGNAYHLNEIVSLTQRLEARTN
jgi:hypothetical protein